jgi:hypothetical protein
MGKTKKKKISIMAEKQDLPLLEGVANKQKSDVIRDILPCLKCSNECVNGIDAIECDGCNKWAHQTCIEMSEDDYEKAAEEETKLNWICDVCREVVKQHYSKDHNPNESFWFNELKKAYEIIKNLTVEKTILNEKLEVKCKVPTLTSYSEAFKETMQVQNKPDSHKQVYCRESLGETVIVVPVDDNDNMEVNTCSLIKQNINPKETNINVKASKITQKVKQSSSALTNNPRRN